MGKRKTFRISYSSNLKAGMTKRLKSKEACYEFIDSHDLDMALILDGDTQNIVETYIADRHKPSDEALDYATK